MRKVFAENPISMAGLSAVAQALHLRIPSSTNSQIMEEVKMDENEIRLECVSSIWIFGRVVRRIIMMDRWSLTETLFWSFT